MQMQGASVMMNIFAEHFEALQNTILEREYDPNVINQCDCEKGPAIFRCQECFQCRPSCRNCVVASHRHLPLHRIQEWVGTHFAPKELCDLGFTISLGHYGERCPNVPNTSPGRRTILVHTNGIHHTRIIYCHCAAAAIEPLQLAQAGYFPATIDRPETAFTFKLLKNFHAHSLSSKKSAYDYYSALQHLTNNAFPHTTPVSFCFFCHLWRTFAHELFVSSAI
jgi:hypothetical protein